MSIHPTMIPTTEFKSVSSPVLEEPVYSTETRFGELIDEAIALPASDLFLTAVESGFEVTVRHLGKIRPWCRFSREEGLKLISHVKANAGMDVSRSPVPKDGRTIRSLEDGRRVDLRISILPTLYGEDMSLRILQREGALLCLENLGFHPRNLYRVTSLLNKSGGMILLSGPTGTGKTTTLYACLHLLNDGTRKINTIEDPIEYTLSGIHQSQVNLARGVDFPELLRGVLRQSPDVIMVGEIRDRLTAETAVRAANSGQLVFATSHAPTAASAIESMLALGVKPQYLATALVGILSQRLVRVLCPKCRYPIQLERTGGQSPFSRVASLLSEGEGDRIYMPQGCRHCHQSGYHQRTGVVEVLRVSPEIRHMIHHLAPTRSIHDKSVQQGMIDLRRAGLLKLAQGITSTEELFRMLPYEPNAGKETDSAGESAAKEDA
jgi:type II secretory ATPase GspE/PulE/Tfp pilus assembly ATPase PilB-like protein